MAGDEANADLVREAMAGDRAALAQLLLGYYGDLRRHIAARLSDELQGVTAEEDLLHETFIRAAQQIGSFEWRSARAFRSWLNTIAENLIKDATKRRRRERRAWPDGPAAGGSGDESSVAALIERLAGGPTPRGSVQRRENARRLWAALAVLPPDQRDIIRRYYLQDESLEQIAEATDRTRDAVRGICYRARKNLRAILGRSSLYFSG
jgi:RNA polymerase sigma-70 factor, ECF subfamily